MRPGPATLQGLIEGWRNELYPAVQAFHDDPAFLLERAAAPHFGIKAYGEPAGFVCMLEAAGPRPVLRAGAVLPAWVAPQSPIPAQRTLL